MGSRVIRRDLGYDDMRLRLKSMKGSYTKVGVQADSKEQDGITDLVTVAAANEFGTEHIPERSFMRSTFAEERDRLKVITAAEADAVMAGKKTTEQSLQQIGEYYQGRIQAKIQSHPPPANSPATIKAKGSSGTLIDSGTLVQSIRHVEILGGQS